MVYGLVLCSLFNCHFYHSTLIVLSVTSNIYSSCFSWQKRWHRAILNKLVLLGLAFQLSGSFDRMYEEQAAGQVLPWAARTNPSLAAPWLLSPQACPAHPQISPVAPGNIYYCSHLSKECHFLPWNANSPSVAEKDDSSPKWRKQHTALG